MQTERECVESQWSPIETAPKDGTRALVHTEDGVTEAWFDQYKWICAVQASSDEYPPLSCEPTHWTPMLPPPPKGKKK